jgi:2-oxoacid:acceptor oxidoreductase gamma subunit (pyruvate/2-ketoisovalerate family)
MQRLKFYGLGGQGVVTAGKTLSTAVSIHNDQYAITVPAYGHERRGAPVYTDIVVDDAPILVNCFVYEPDIVLVLDDSIIDKNVDVSRGKHEGTVLVLNTDSQETARMYAEKYGFKDVFYINATQIAIDCIGREIPNGPMLGALAITGVTPIESVELALKETFGEKAGEKNANAARQAFEQVKKI